MIALNNNKNLAFIIFILLSCSANASLHCDTTRANKNLLAAVFRNDIPFAKEALGKGAEVDHYSNVSLTTPLHAAVDRKFTDMACFLLGQGADPNYASEKLSFSPLVIACLEGDYVLIAFLAACDADLNETQGAFSPLTAAIERDRQECVELLLSLGADPHQTNGYASPLSIAFNERNLGASMTLLILQHKLSSPSLPEHEEIVIQGLSDYIQLKHSATHLQENFNAMLQLNQTIASALNALTENTSGQYIHAYEYTNMYIEIKKEKRDLINQFLQEKISHPSETTRAEYHVASFLNHMAQCDFSLQRSALEQDTDSFDNNLHQLTPDLQDLYLTLYALIVIVDNSLQTQLQNLHLEEND
jgi:hypothetical protein